MSKIMPYLWRLNNWLDKKAIHIRAWLDAVTDEPERPYEEPDVVEMLWKARCKG